LFGVVVVSRFIRIGLDWIGLNWIFSSSLDLWDESTLRGDMDHGLIVTRPYGDQPDTECISAQAFFEAAVWPLEVLP
jgi:hypothetical protein